MAHQSLDKRDDSRNESRPRSGLLAVIEARRDPGSRKNERIEENLRAADVELTDDEYTLREAELGKIDLHCNRTDAYIAKLRDLGQWARGCRCDHESRTCRKEDFLNADNRAERCGLNVRC
jgi:hypothetical protein